MCLGHKLFAVVFALLLAGCTGKTSTFFEANTADAAAKQIAAKVHHPVRVLQIEINSYALSMQVQDPAAPSHVDEYRCESGIFSNSLSVSGPRPVSLNLINPKLEENLFNLDEVNLTSVPAAVQEAIKQTALEGGGAVQQIEIKRRLSIFPAPQNGDVQWTISVRSPRETATAYADPRGHINRLDLEGTERAKTIDFTAGGMLLDQTVGRIRESFGGTKPVFVELDISPKRIWFLVRALEPPHGVRKQICDLNGLHNDVYSDLQEQMQPGMRQLIDKTQHKQSPTESECFTLDEIDWSKLRDMGKAAIQQMGKGRVGISEIKLSRRPGYMAQPVEWRFTMERDFNKGFVEYDLKGNQLRVQLPLPATVVADLFEPENTRAILNAIREDFGPQTKLRGIELRRQAAYVRASPPDHPEQAWEYAYSLRDGMRIWTGTANSTVDRTDATKINADEVVKMSEALPELMKKAVALLGPTETGVDRVEFYRYGVLASSKQLLVEINIADGPPTNNGRVIYDSTGRVVR